MNEPSSMSPAQEPPEWRDLWRCASMHDHSGRRGIWFRRLPDGCLDVRGGREGDDAALTLSPQNLDPTLIAELTSILEHGAYMQESEGPDAQVKPFAPHAECINSLGRVKMPAPVVTAEMIGNVVKSMFARYEEELFSLDREGLQQRWSFHYDQDATAEWNLYQFSKMLDQHRNECRRWEEKHHGRSNVVERVRDTYELPRIREFRQEFARHLSALPPSEIGH